jgi:N-acetyl-gamma-glutamyl-phosphate reductase
MLRVGVAGASGYVGGELLRCLAAHPRLSVAAATADRHVGTPIARHAPSLAAAYRDVRFEPTSPDVLSLCDVVFLALPHGASAPLVAELAGRVELIVDLGADLRLGDAESWERWYGGAHPVPDLLGTAVYGLVERHRRELVSASLVAVPGCYPTATVLALGPLVDAGLAGDGPCVVDAMSGASGAGATPSDLLHVATLVDDVTAYGVDGHRHIAEMERELDRSVAFTPHLMAMDRGLLATCHVAASSDATPAAVTDALFGAYDAERFVVVTDAPPRPKSVRGTNVAHVAARLDERTGQLLAMCAIDNLGKGAAGQAIQCANVALGFDEADGLCAAGVWP